MDTINVIRYCMAKTKTELLAEVAVPRSMDHGMGHEFAGLCVAVEPGQGFDPETLAPKPIVLRNGDTLDAYGRMRHDYAGSVATPSHLISYLHTQGGIARRTMWRMTVLRSDLIGLADRVVGAAPVQIHLADGVLLRPGAEVLSAKRVKL